MHIGEALMRRSWKSIRLLVAGTVIPLVIVNAQPAVTIAEGNSFDLGNIYRGVIATKDLTLQNTGNDTLRIGKVDVSCGCTGTRMSREVVAPGDTASLFISFNSSNFAGPIHKTVMIHTNVPGSESVVVSFSGKVVEEVTVSVQYLMFQNVKVRHQSSATFRISNSGSEPLALRGFRTQLKGFSLRLPKDPIPPGESAEVAVEFTPQDIIPVLTDGVFITTSNRHQPEIYLSVYGNIVDDKNH
jgi:hypothetical protein